jgi:neutral amino acid transport system ATP-binding protein
MEQNNQSQHHDSILTAVNLSKSFGGLKAVNNASIDVKYRSITGLIGPNGAGKSTLFNLLSNFLKADTGKILFEGKAIQNLAPHQIARKGFIRTFQVARVLSRLICYWVLRIKRGNFYSRWCGIKAKFGERRKKIGTKL